MAASAFHDGLRAFDNRNWKWINMGILNARSIKNKDLLVKELITEHNLEIVLITETWLRQEDDIWKKSKCLTSEKWEIHCVNRKTGHKGGRLVLLHNENINVQLDYTREMQTFEYALWLIKSRKKSFKVLGVYHPPPQKFTNPQSINFWMNS